MWSADEGPQVFVIHHLRTRRSARRAPMHENEGVRRKEGWELKEKVGLRKGEGGKVNIPWFGH
jgi:hypothetical protein